MRRMKSASYIHSLWFATFLLFAFSTDASAQQLFFPAVMTGNENPTQTPILITEFMASTSDALDWIELYNRSQKAIELDGWYLTDDAENLTKWQFPQKRLAADSYLIIFASGQDQRGNQLHTNFKLKREGEYLALVQPDGATVAWDYGLRYPSQFEGISYGLDNALNARFMALSTPARANDAEPANRAPIVRYAGHSPAVPRADEPLVITATVQMLSTPIQQVTLHYQLMFGEIAMLPMQDDGLHHDLAAGDGVYGAEIPHTLYQAGEMIRYYLTAEDEAGQIMRWPILGNSAKQPLYLGTMVDDPTHNSSLPRLHWFVQNTIAAETRDGTRASLFYEGNFYDNLFVRTRGITTNHFPLKSFKFDFNKEHYFQLTVEPLLGIPPDLKPMDEINLNRTVIDRSYIRQLLAWESYRDVGTPYSLSFAVQLYQNNFFHGLPIFVEQPDERYLKRNGLDPNGAFYKMYSYLGNGSLRYNKQSRLHEDHSDLAAFVDGISPENNTRTAYLFDHVNLPAVINYLAATVVMMDYDHVAANYHLYRDTEGSGEWMIVPWDKDLAFGHTPERHAAHPIYGHPFFGDSDHVQFEIEDRWNRLFEAIYHTPETREMYLRRLRSVMDELLQPPNTPAHALRYERRIDELVALMQDDVALDAPNWEFPPNFIALTEQIKRDYLAVRRRHLYNSLGPEGAGLIPSAQPDHPTILFGEIEANPASGNVDEAYFTLVNPNDSAVDISGWRVEGDVTIQFQPGVVIPAGGTLYVVADVVAFRNRVTTPTGGEGYFVQGSYQGLLEEAGELWLAESR